MSRCLLSIPRSGMRASRSSGNKAMVKARSPWAPPCAPSPSASSFALTQRPTPLLSRRGLATARELAMGELVLRVPEDALMNGKSARQDEELARVLALYPSLLDVQVLCVHLLREVAKGRTSERYRYLVHLPRYYHTASFFSACEAQALQERMRSWEWIPAARGLFWLVFLLGFIQSSAGFDRSNLGFLGF